MACRLGGFLFTVRGCLVSRPGTPGLDGWDAPRGSPSQTVRVGALFGAVVLCYEVELHAAVLFRAVRMARSTTDVASRRRKEYGMAAQVLGEGESKATS